MQKIFLLLALVIFNGFGQEQERSFFFRNKTLYSTYNVITNPLHLRALARDMLYYLEHNTKAPLSLKDPDYFRKYITLDQVKKTLQFVIQTINEDEASGNFRILNPQFLQKHFGTIRWRADCEAAKKKHNKILPTDGQIRLTSYVFFKVNGSRVKTKEYNQALYQLLASEDEAKKYTRQDIFGGLLETPGYTHIASPFVWLSKHDIEEALMQGSVIVQFPDGTSQLYNVHINNGYAYDRSKGKYDQKRYWFFKEIDDTYWFFRNAHKKNWLELVSSRKDIALAGDVDHIGYGKLIALFARNPQTKKKEMRLGILADTGGAFKNNLYQLDLYGGCVYEADLRAHLNTVPRFAHACVLFKK